MLIDMCTSSGSECLSSLSKLRLQNGFCPFLDAPTRLVSISIEIFVFYIAASILKLSFDRRSF